MRTRQAAEALGVHDVCFNDHHARLILERARSTQDRPPYEPPEDPEVRVETTA
jgi:hypothetical protein